MKIILPITIAALIVASGAFYWWGWRPEQIRKECAVWSIKTIDENNSGRGYVPVAERADRNHKDFNTYYERCLKERGQRR